MICIIAMYKMECNLNISNEAQTIVCSGCNIEKNINLYRKKSRQCKTCISAISKSYKDKYWNTDDGFIMQCIANARERHRSRATKKEIDYGNFNLSFSYVKTISPLCYYSGIPVVFKKFHPYQASLERIDPNNTYNETGNVCWCLLKFNTFNQWTKDKYENVFIKYEKFIEERKAEMLITDREPHIGTGVTAKKSEKQKRYIDLRERGSFTYLMWLLTRNTNSDNKKKFANNVIEKWTTKEYQDLWIKQNGLCAYSGIPMDWRKGDYRASKERLNNNQGYEKNNVVLVCQEFNCLDRTAQSKSDINLGWSKEEVEKIRQLEKDKLSLK